MSSRVEQLLAQMVEANKQTAKSVDKLLTQVTEGLRNAGPGHSSFNLGNIASTAAGIKVADHFGMLKAAGPGHPAGYDTKWFAMSQEAKDRYMNKMVDASRSFDVKYNNIMKEHSDYKAVLDAGMLETPGGREWAMHRMDQLDQQMATERAKLWKVYDDKKSSPLLGFGGRKVFGYGLAAATAMWTAFNPGSGRVSGTWEHYTGTLAEGMGGYSSPFNMLVRWPLGAISDIIARSAIGLGGM